MTRWTRHKGKKLPAKGSKWDELRRADGEPTTNTPTKINKNFNLTSTASMQAVEARNLAVKRNKRSENRKLKRQRRKTDAMVCFHCRMPGHGMAECPRLLQDNEHGTGVCFKCGSTEHTSHACSAKVPVGKEFAFAKCFVCGEQGHLSKSCPDNPRGLYPSGGCCKLCGSVDHFQKDCPERRIRGEVTAYRLLTNDKSDKRYVSLDDEVTLYESDNEKRETKPLKKPKVVNF